MSRSFPFLLILAPGIIGSDAFGVVRPVPSSSYRRAHRVPPGAVEIGESNTSKRWQVPFMSRPSQNGDKERTVVNSLDSNVANG
eukprot:CAMPEP_0181073428 /NCGR_PEP_ID=MMETSP1070-20121207/29075_1 /TAXON_ID=265543 /ORGANISM="Minutocellus polymorphus, Strain NH13" /LENGTH=83 /DNA_ID=CAMNT_0023154501 /DNA_START=44 /DNA_END=291 /DNA_ORIENTATION=+